MRLLGGGRRPFGLAPDVLRRGRAALRFPVHHVGRRMLLPARGLAEGAAPVVSRFIGRSADAEACSVCAAVATPRLPDPPGSSLLVGGCCPMAEPAAPPVGPDPASCAANSLREAVDFVAALAGCRRAQRQREQCAASEDECCPFHGRFSTFWPAGTVWRSSGARIHLVSVSTRLHAVSFRRRGRLQTTDQGHDRARTCLTAARDRSRARARHAGTRRRARPRCRRLERAQIGSIAHAAGRVDPAVAARHRGSRAAVRGPARRRFRPASAS